MFLKKKKHYSWTSFQNLETCVLDAQVAFIMINRLWSVKCRLYILYSFRHICPVHSILY